MRKFILFFFSIGIIPFSYGQTHIRGKITDETGNALPNVLIFDKNNTQLTQTNEQGEFHLTNEQAPLSAELTFFLETYQVTTQSVPTLKEGSLWHIQLSPISYELSEVIVRKKKNEQNNFRRLRDVEGMTVNAGKKSEVVLLSDMTINKTTNNARQIFSKVVGITMNEGSDGGLQLNIGGRGLNPNRTANFNTRQNGYDISADVLGYPESYYTPPADGIDEIQVVRGAASLQYGTQFGGMINFKMKDPSTEKLSVTQHTSAGSYGLFSSFTEMGGTLNKFSYYSFYNYKKGDGYRPNSHYHSHNGFVNLNYKFNDNNSLHIDVLKFYYLAKQPGGLTNYMFYNNPRQSNRNRNWFRVDWNIVNLRYQHIFNAESRFSIQFFGLQAERSALGFRSWRVSEIDPNQERDLLIGKFKNWGTEARFIQNYNIAKQKSTLLVGVKYYQSKNSSQQGPGSSGNDANFQFATNEYPLYRTQSNFKYPNLNIAFFAENIFRINEKTTITPGIRIEKIKTQADGVKRIVGMDSSGLVILSDTTTAEKVEKNRNVFLVGVGTSHRTKNMEFYGNISQNYRSVTFTDIHSVTPGFAISPTIGDEKGFTSDIGIRGNTMKVLKFDSSLYVLYYGHKIGEYYRVNPHGIVERYRDNVGTALTYGWETLLDWDINKTFWKNEDLNFNTFANFAFTKSRYLKSDIPNIKGNEVEFVPLLNLKSGIGFGYKNFTSSLQLTYVTEQFTDAINQITPKDDNNSGIFGTIPTYYVIDFSAAYKINKYLTLEGSLQNLTNNSYFTRRATGYPGPGIIPSEPINFIFTLDIHL